MGDAIETLPKGRGKKLLREYMENFAKKREKRSGGCKAGVTNPAGDQKGRAETSARPGKQRNSRKREYQKKMEEKQIVSQIGQKGGGGHWACSMIGVGRPWGKTKAGGGGVRQRKKRAKRVVYL